MTGAEQVYTDDNEKIIMSTSNQYKKVLKTERPKPSDSWYPTEEMEQQDSQRTSIPTPRMKKVEKGLKRWKALPEPTVSFLLK